MKQTTDITMIIDRSGSMDQLRDETIHNFNFFLKEQQALPGDARFTLVQFDHDYQVDFSGAIRDVRPLEHSTYQPRGSTALLDALGRTVSDIGERLKRLPEAERPTRVVVALITDGLENASHVFTKAQVREMVRLQQDVYKWTFYFLGANMDAIAEGQDLGMAAANVANYGANTKGVRAVYGNLSASVGRIRSTGQVGSFTNQEQVELNSTAEDTTTPTTTTTTWTGNKN